MDSASRLALIATRRCTALRAPSVGTREDAARFIESEEMPSTTEDHGENSFFEVTIRALGGLMGAWSLSGEPVFRDTARRLGNNMYSAFNTPSGMPAHSVDVGTGYFQQDPASRVVRAGCPALPRQLHPTSYHLLVHVHYMCVVWLPPMHQCGYIREFEFRISAGESLVLARGTAWASCGQEALHCQGRLYVRSMARNMCDAGRPANSRPGDSGRRQTGSGRASGWLRSGQCGSRVGGGCRRRRGVRAGGRAVASMAGG